MKSHNENQDRIDTSADASALMKRRAAFYAGRAKIMNAQFATLIEPALAYLKAAEQSGVAINQNIIDDFQQSGVHEKSAGKCREDCAT